MAAVVNVIEDTYHAVNKATQEAYDAVKDAAVFVWQDVISASVEVVIGLFGIEDEDVVSVALGVNRIFKDDYSISKDVVRAKTIEIRNPDRVDAFKDEFLANIKIPSGRLKKFFNYCIDNTDIGTPQLDFSSSGANSDVIQEKLDSVEDPDGQYIRFYQAKQIDAFTLCRFKMRDSYSYEGYRDGFTYNDHEDYEIEAITVNSNSMDIDIRRKHLTKYKYYNLTKTQAEIEKGHEIYYIKFKGSKYEEGTNLSISFDGIDIDIDPDANTRLEIMLDWIEQYNDQSDRTFDIWVAYEDTEDDIDYVKLFLISVNKNEDINDLTDDSFTIQQQDDDSFSIYGTTLLMDSEDDNKGNATFTGIKIKEYIANEKWEYPDDPTSTTSKYTRLTNIDIIASDETLNENVDVVYDNTVEEITYTDSTTIIENYTFNEDDLYLYFEFSEDEDSKDKFNISLYNLTANDEEDLALTRNSIKVLDTMPVIIIRNNGEFWDKDYDENVYNSQVKACKLLGTDYDDLMDNLKNNEDIDKVLDAYIWFYIQPNDPDEIVSKYLYVMTEFIHNQDISWSNEDLTITDKQLLPYRYKNIDCVLVWDTLDKSYVDNANKGGRIYEHEITDDYLKVRKWVNDTSYFEYTFNAICSMVFITNGEYKGMVNGSPTSDNFPFPIAYSIISEFTPIERNQIMYKSLKLCTNALDVQHLAWYQTEEFAVFLEVLTIVIIVAVSIFTFGAGTQAAIAIGEALLLMIAVKKTIKYINKNVKVPWLRAALDVLVLTLASMAGDWSDIIYAITTTAAITAYGVQTYYQAKTEIKQEEQEDFLEKAEKRFEEMYNKFEELNDSYLTTDFLAWLEQTNGIAKIVPEYTPLDSQRYKAISMQTDYALLFDTTSKVQVDLPRY